MLGGGTLRIDDRVSLRFLPKGGGKMRWYELLGGKYISACKACGKLGGSRGMLPWEILILDLLSDTIWWNLGLFLHKHNLHLSGVNNNVCPCILCCLMKIAIEAPP